ncbi:MAG: hypothetical protein V1740_06755 [Candidatus Woesearchaeota archaeon]
MRNLEVADILDKMADLVDIKGEKWEPIAYRRAAISIRNISKAVEDIYREKGLKGLDDIPGVGSGISKKIEKILLNKRLDFLEKLKKEIPSAIIELLDIQNIGPRQQRKSMKNLR